MTRFDPRLSYKDSLIDMESFHEGETDEDNTPLLMSASEDYSSERKQLREENADLRQRLRRAQKKINEHMNEMKGLNERYYSLGENSISFKDELEATQILLLKKQENIQELQTCIDRLRTEIFKTGQKSLMKLFDGIAGSECDGESQVIANGFANHENDDPHNEKRPPSHRKSAELNPDDLVLSCTLCSEKIRIDEITSHSRICSAQSQTKYRPILKPDTLNVYVTLSQADIENTSFKIVTKTNLMSYSSHHYDVRRSESDCVWFRNNLLELCTECVVPPLVEQTSANGKTRELERFLLRLCKHRMLRESSLLKLFLTGSNEDIQTAKEDFLERQALKQNAIEIKQSEMLTGDKGKLVKCKKYLESVVHGLNGLINHLQNNLENNSTKGRGRWFKRIAESEPTDTYLKMSAQALSKVCDDLERGQEEDEKLIICDLQSVLEYIYCCQELLRRVENSANRFLYWEEEVRECEEMKKNINRESNSDLTRKWAEANSNLLGAKAHLEMMYESLANELEYFDYQKEMELRDIFIEYTTLQSEHYEKVECSTSMKLVNIYYLFRFRCIQRILCVATLTYLGGFVVLSFTKWTSICVYN
ncbi:uncharacterized protein LOC124439998 isoform X2 [Xenia sp. Carnegie-2017]|uniref:uncharacterized protein LOC124439998 isoform X2 n=1 Tax=Xenia sp. Carnegie-2017 TaxID=2897299 RepID=UPI001F045B87|nr:uncharacterized protein LOC124439998 isoform X2 [Xenia sp. Carnegie-2017]